MSSRKVTRKRFSCGHKGFGAGYCHRCEMADKLEEMAKNGQRYVTNKKKKKPKEWSRKEMLQEAERLRKEGKG